MPIYRFISKNGELHQMELDLPDDKAAREEAKQAFAEAVSDAVGQTDCAQITIRVERDGRTLYSAEMNLTSNKSDV